MLVFWGSRGSQSTVLLNTTARTRGELGRGGHMLAPAKIPLAETPTESVVTVEALVDQEG